MLAGPGRLGDQAWQQSAGACRLQRSWHLGPADSQGECVHVSRHAHILHVPSYCTLSRVRRCTHLEPLHAAQCHSTIAMCTLKATVDCSCNSTHCGLNVSLPSAAEGCICGGHSWAQESAVPQGLLLVAVSLLLYPPLHDMTRHDMT